MQAKSRYRGVCFRAVSRACLVAWRILGHENSPGDGVAQTAWDEGTASRLLRHRRISGQICEPTASEGMRVSLVKVEPPHPLQRVGVALELSSAGVAADSQGTRPITLFREATGNAGWWKSPCPVCRAGTRSTDYGAN